MIRVNSPLKGRVIPHNSTLERVKPATYKNAITNLHALRLIADFKYKYL